ncbi:hypothetical protein CRG98_012027 [Punica granatum]|uniref:Uncharacterized protein n=1 Tax=Punica granatum TaxID=22663 RepID=A0A2I0KGG7_PUNGR|nr:hypothetical protein CRG98_012027 [Punica granatum]
MATSGRTSTREAPVYVACRGCVGANFNRGCPSCTSLGNAYRGWMMSEVVSVQALNANAPVFIVDVTRGGTSVPNPFPVKVLREEAQEEFSERREPVHHSSPVTGVSL